ncbi:MAG: CoA transferase [Saprospiraceae bacterium]|nr:CoA transferase [Saprospiraceae bacterium]
MQPILQGLKVVELASVLAGPAVGMFFAELGAQVIKVENKTAGGDVTRSWKLPAEDPATPYSAYYASVNWGKTVWMLDLNDSTDRAQVLEAIRAADIVISNFRPDSARKMGMDYDSLQPINPRLLFGHITGFGDDDPLPAFDVILQAEAGFLFMNGEPGGEPVKMPVALIDLLAAHQLKEGLLLALLQRERTGQGAYVSVSLLEAAVASLANQATNWLMAGQIPQRMGTMHPNIAPYGDVFYGADQKPVVLAVGNDRQFQALCKALGLETLSADERFSSNANRVRNRIALREALAPAFARFERGDLLQRLHAIGVPAAGIRNMQEVFELPLAQAMILDEAWPDGMLSQRVKTAVFKIKIK